MRNLVKADLHRIIRKKSFYISLLFIISFVAIVYLWLTEHNWNSFHYAVMQGTSTISGCMLIVGFFIYRSVYADEFKVMTIITAIGKGISRVKIVLANFIESIILILFFSCFTLLAVFVVGWSAGLHFTNEETFILVINAIYIIHLYIGFITFCGLIIYITESIPLGTFGYLFVCIIIPVIAVLLDQIPAIQKYHIHRYLYSGWSDRFIADMVLGMPEEAIASFLGSFIAFVGLSVFIIIKVFEKKELNF